MKIKGGGDIPAGVLALFSIFSPTLSKDGPVFSPYSLFSPYEDLRVFWENSHIIFSVFTHL